MDILKAQKTDVDAITALVAEVSKHDVLPLLNEQGQQEYQQRVLPDLKTTLEGDNFVSLKAVLDGQMVGYAALRNGDYLTHLFVSNKLQGSGLGTKLLKRILESTEESEISLRSSVNAVGFYQHHGFVATSEESDFNGIRFVPMSLVRSASSS
ncbi:GNAT family N-acetyltransferase [Vibrio sp. SCSIO 43135]|uniref:GNAT family N-acetyltransferase n=1 Tax=Vibrio sp. SCSIO 43135 TaxID=2819096 RepID=UPI00207569AA|nr:GNAT family N-acetyltransferase [Vibrio sp. SCSIO 43135]USD42840.1 GNAT family N-acetyltransferase [Vibrio sp. SCSIO 43135]